MKFFLKVKLFLAILQKNDFKICSCGKKSYLCSLSFLLFIRFISNCTVDKTYAVFYFKAFANSHITIPPHTLTLSECLVPN